MANVQAPVIDHIMNTISATRIGNRSYSIPPIRNPFLLLLCLECIAHITRFQNIANFSSKNITHTLDLWENPPTPRAFKFISNATRMQLTIVLHYNWTRDYNFRVCIHRGECNDIVCVLSYGCNASKSNKVTADIV